MISKALSVIKHLCFDPCCIKPYQLVFHFTYTCSAFLLSSFQEDNKTSAISNDFKATVPKDRIRSFLLTDNSMQNLKRTFKYTLVGADTAC